ncbi:lipopolysaccharide biosynthesis protein [Williamwhitmania taraxaci]|uniref:Membrane protein involved in the export of O-antigen and teichoic acid n=1 Tax=Williamwhitmania taraxaci TaxID=1640674 RepID=A0A1G6LDL1_9BACT|nr:oligosaccharide flippase family protein [Williamwhitmania taraxaci]SDC40865.1 Membrane protein involved in the export of O-antigen and teichoic acid [Williamwhitmania taraxaci]
MKLSTRLWSYIHLPDKSFSKNFLTLLSGTSVAQAIPFFVGPLISRLYTPADIGFFVLLSSTAGILSILSTGTYEYGVLVEKNDEDAKKIGETAIALSFVFLLFSFLLLLTIFLIANHNSPTGISWLWFLVPFQAFLAGASNIQNFYLNRKRQYTDISGGKIIRASGMSTLQVISGFAKKAWGLFPSQIIGQLITVFYLWRKSKLQPKKNNKGIEDTVKHLLKFKKYPLLTLPGAVINELSIQVPIYILQFFFTASAVGLYALPHKFLNAPIMLIGATIGQVFFQRSVEKKNQDEPIADTALSTYWFLFKLGLIPFSIIMVFGDSLFAWYFGENWRMSGVYAQMLSPWLFFVLCGSPLSNLFIVLGKLRLSLKLNIGLLLLRITALLIGAIWFNQTVAILLFAIASVAYWVAITYYSLHLSGAKIATVALNSLTLLFTAVLFLALLRLLIL